MSADAAASPTTSAVPTLAMDLNSLLARTPLSFDNTIAKRYLISAKDENGAELWLTVDPYTVYEVAMALASAYNEQLKDWKQERWQKSIEQALIRIEAKLDHLTERVNALFSYQVDVARMNSLLDQRGILSSARDVLAKAINAVDGPAANGWPDIKKADEGFVFNSKNRASDAAGIFMQVERHGFTAFAAAFVAACVETVAALVLKGTRRTAAGRLGTYIAYFERALSTEANSLSTIRDKLKTTTQGHLDNLNSFPKSGSIGRSYHYHYASLYGSWREPGHDFPPRVKWWIYVDIFGDVQSGYRAGGQYHTVTEAPTKPEFPTRPGSRITSSDDHREEHRIGYIIEYLESQRNAYHTAKANLDEAELHVAAASKMLEALRTFQNTLT